MIRKALYDDALRSKIVDRLMHSVVSEISLDPPVGSAKPDWAGAKESKQSQSAL